MDWSMRYRVTDLHTGLVSGYQFLDLGWSQPPQPFLGTPIGVWRPRGDHFQQGLDMFSLVAVV
jgi:hypothetical protein